MHWSQFINKNLQQAFEPKLVYTLGVTVQDMVLDIYFLQIASLIFRGVLMFLMLHLSQVLVLLTLNIFLLAGFVVSKDAWL